MPTLPNARHERFAQGLAAGKPAAEAYKAAGFQTASGNSAEAAGSRLLRNVKVAARVAELLGRASEGVVLTRQWVLERLIENVNRAMQAAVVRDEDGQPVGEYRYEGSVANRALELLGKELSMFVDRKAVTIDDKRGPTDWDRQSLVAILNDARAGSPGAAKANGRGGEPDSVH